MQAFSDGRSLTWTALKTYTKLLRLTSSISLCRQALNRAMPASVPGYQCYP